MRKNTGVALMIGLGLLTPATARSQEVPLSELLVRLSLTPLPLAGDHETHFNQVADQAFSAPLVINQQIVSQLATAPVGSPGGGLTFTFDPVLGTFSRASDSFGPTFADRALTNGKGKLAIGTIFQRSRYTSYEGEDLRNGDIKFYLRHSRLTGEPSESDIAETSARVDISSATTTTFASYGMTDRWDLVVAVPVVHVSIDASLTARLLRLSTGAESDVHRIAGTAPGMDSLRVSTSGSASGLGDMLLRTKYRLVSGRGGGLAAAVDFNLPTGDERNLLGAAGPRVTLTAIASSTHGRVSPHVNVSYTAVGGNTASAFGAALPDEIGYRVGADYVATSKVTVSGTIIGRSQLNAGHLELADSPWPYTDPSGARTSITLREYQFRTGTLNTASMAFGGKVNLRNNFVASASLLVALTSAGVTARLTPAFSVDYTF